MSHLRGYFAPLLLLLLTLACSETSRGSGDISSPGPDPGQARLNDAWITTKIQSQYFADADVRSLDIAITTESGIVTLSGFVDDQRAHDQAVSIARNTDGVFDVVDRLVLRAAALTPDGRRDFTDQMGDSLLTARIQSQYFLHPDIRSSAIDVTAANGIVMLSGAVDSDPIRQTAVHIARHTDGVTDVIDWLEVRGTDVGPAARFEDWMTDRAITTRVQAKFFLDREVKGRAINVDTSAGVVTLDGSVGSPAERRHAVALARSVYGVREVIDELTIEQAPTPSAQSSPPPTIHDAWITVRIQSKFFLNDQIRARNLDVDTAAGVVTLSGSVQDEQARAAALELARSTPGVLEVVDRLVIRP